VIVYGGGVKSTNSDFRFRPSPNLHSASSGVNFGLGNLNCNVYELADAKKEL
jgi:hypothetical protein